MYDHTIIIDIMVSNWFMVVCMSKSFNYNINTKKEHNKIIIEYVIF